MYRGCLAYQCQKRAYETPYGTGRRMAETARISGSARDWLASRREELNARFKLARRRFGKLDAQAVLALNAELLPPLADGGAAGSDELLSEIFDLVILHAGRGLLSSGVSPMRTLLSETFLRLKPLLLKHPRQLPSALSNAVENLGAKGGEFARGMSAMAAALQSADQVRDAGAVLAWRLGEARLREYALNAAAALPNSVLLEALDLGGWPAVTAPLALAALNDDTWIHPRERVRPTLLLQLGSASPQKIAETGSKLSAGTAAAWANMRFCGTCGEFEGYGGNFFEPPKLLNAGKNAQRHRFFVRSGEINYRIDADVFGWVCRPDPTCDFPIQDTAWRAGVGATLVSSLKGTKKTVLFSDGAFFAGGKLEQVQGLAQASTYCAAENTLAATQYDSFRVRIFSPARPVLQ